MFKFNSLVYKNWEAFVDPKGDQNTSWDKTREIRWSPAHCCGARFETQENSNEVNWNARSTHTKGIRILPGRVDCFVSDLEKKTEVKVGGNILTLVTQKQTQDKDIIIPTKPHTFTDDGNDVEVTIPYFSHLREVWRISDKDVLDKWDSIQRQIKLYNSRDYIVPVYYRDCTLQALREWQYYCTNMIKIASESPFQLYIYTKEQATEFTLFQRNHLSHMDVLWMEDGIYNNNYDLGGRLNIVIFGAK